jgi:hypothetical protein
MNKPLIPFEPVPVGPRHDGWTADKQIRFIEALVETACVEEACRRVGMSDSAAYRLRQRPCGRAFRDAWDAALDCGMHRLEPAALSRAINGVARPIFHKGEQVGEWRHFDERLSMFLLRSRRPARYGKWIDRMLAPEPPDSNDHYRFQDQLFEISLKAPEREGNPIGGDEDDEGDDELFEDLE